MSPLDAFFRRQVPFLYRHPDGRLSAGDLRPSAILSGSFNPLHHGHLGLAQTAARSLGAPVGYELSVINADKPPLTPEELDRRLRQFADGAAVWVTREPTFLGKSRLFPGAAFVLGVDTAVRLVDPKYYGGEADRDAALERMREAGCRLVVAGRADRAGVFCPSEEVPVAEAFLDMFVFLGEDEFRADVSSSQLRGG